MSLPHHGRQVARRLAMQAVYAWQLTEQTPSSLLDDFADDPDYAKSDPEYFSLLVRGIISSSAHLDELLQPFLDRPLAQVDPVERAILRVAVYELEQRQEIPFRVVLNEAVNLAKKFGAEDGYKFINGILDKLIPSLRALEYSAAR